jgi:rsbT co-antagonist protein RsbR
LRRIIIPDVADPYRRRQGVLVVVVSAVLFLLALVLSVNALIVPRPSLMSVVLNSFSALIFLTCLISARMGRIRPAAYAITWIPGFVTAIYMISAPHPVALVFLCIPILFASVLLSSLIVIPITLLNLLVIGVATRGVLDPTMLSAAMFMILVAVIAYMSAWSMERAQQSVQSAGAALEQANQALHVTNQELEDRVVQRTQALHEREVTLEQALSQQQQMIAELQRSQATIQQLSAPILPVAQGILVAPLIGMIDGQRIASLIQQILQSVEKEQARYLILDVTGMPIIDTEVAQVLMHVTQSVRLLGGRVILTGIRPEVAQTLVGLGINLNSMLTRNTLEGGIREALKR